MTLARIVAAAGLLVMTLVIGWGFAAGDFFAEGGELTSMPWGIVTLVDLYTGFVLFSCWILFRERSLLIGLAWTLAMMLLGFWAGCLYVLVALQTSGGHWPTFWMGSHANT